MTKELMIKAIYEKIADKTLSVGCYLLINNKQGIFLKQSESGKIQYWDKSYLCYSDDEVDNPIIEIIGHPVMLGDYLDWQEDNYEILEKLNESDLTVIGLWKEKRKPIQEQSKECIKYIYNLIK